MKKGKKIAIIVVIFLAVIYFVVKGVLLWSVPKPQSLEIETKEAFDKKDTITIKKSISKENDYFSFENLKIRNDFEVFDKEHKVYKIKNTDIRVVFSKKTIDDYVTWVKENSKNMGMYYDLTKDLEKNNIDTDYKLYEYLFKNFDPKLNLFSSINAFRKDHAIKLALSFYFDKFTVITGDYDGYICLMNASKAVFINHNNYSYFIHIFSKEYSDEKLYDLLSTIVFE